MRIAVVIPAYNEEENVGEVVRGVKSLSGVGEVLAVVVDDGSVDETGKIAAEAGADVVVRHHRNMGLGVALGRLWSLELT